MVDSTLVISTTAYLDLERTIFTPRKKKKKSNISKVQIMFTIVLGASNIY